MTERVRRLLGGPEQARLVDRLVRRLEHQRPLTGTLTVPDATDAERSALGALTGGRPTASVRLDVLEAVVRESGAATSLADAVRALRGPILVRADAAAAHRARWDAAFARLVPLLDERPDYADWAERIRTSGLVRRLAAAPDAAEALLTRTARVLAVLPVPGESLPVLAARLLGDAHALDEGRPEATLVLAALDPGGHRHADARRRAWASAGVALDALSSSVLVHRLPLAGPLGALTSGGEPVVLTLRQLRAPGLVRVEPGAVVFACENPSVVEAAADALGGDCAPLVCVGGQPSLAALLLLRALTTGGVELHYHGDFDWGGIRIANRLREQVGFTPWRFGTEHLLAAVQPGALLAGPPVDAAWDPGLRSALEHRGTGLQEEQVIGALLGDLAVEPRGPGGSNSRAPQSAE